jgi:hypothetical protein
VWCACSLGGVSSACCCFVANSATAYTSVVRWTAVSS